MDKSEYPEKANLMRPMLSYIVIFFMLSILFMSSLYFHNKYLVLAFTPQPLNQSTSMTTTDETGPSFLKVAVLVDNTGGGTAKPSDFTIDMRTSFETGPYPNMFDGSENGTIVAMNTPGAYIINVNQKETVNTPYGIEFSGDCSFDYGNGGRGSTNPGDKQTCIVTMIYPNF